MERIKNLIGFLILVCFESAFLIGLTEAIGWKAKLGWGIFVASLGLYLVDYIICVFAKKTFSPRPWRLFKILISPVVLVLW